MSFVLRPVSDVSVDGLEIVGAASAYAAINEPAATHDGDATFVKNATDANASALLGLTNTPTEFFGMSGLRVRVVLRAFIDEAAVTFSTYAVTHNNNPVTFSGEPIA